VADEREGVGGPSRTNLCREWSSYSRDGRRGQIHDGSCLRRPAGSSSCPGTTSTDQRQPSLGWPDVRPHASNPSSSLSSPGSGGAREEQGCGGERAAKESGATGVGGRENPGIVDLSSEETNMNGARNCVQWNYRHALDGCVQQLEFHGHYSKYRWEILSSPRTVRVVILMSGSVSWATMVSEPGSPMWGVRSAVIFFILAGDADAWTCHNFFWNETFFPD
jgi:hypothetical protein